MSNEESKSSPFIRVYVDNEVKHEEEKKLHVARTRERGPYGMNIRKAAYRTFYGAKGSHPILQRYAGTSEPKSVAKLKSADPLDDLSEIDDSSSDESVSQGGSSFGGDDLTTELPDRTL